MPETHPMIKMLQEQFSELRSESAENLRLTRELRGDFREHLITRKTQDERVNTLDKIVRGDGNGQKGLTNRLITLELEKKFAGVRSLGLQGWLMVIGSCGSCLVGAAAVVMSFLHHAK